MIVFSFSLFGSNPKYTLGALANAEIIGRRFPDAQMFVYVAPSVPAEIVSSLRAHAHVRSIDVPECKGTLGTFYRYLAIDISGCDIMFARDTDSRIHERDAACIEDFIASDKKIQIIRDHKYHRNRVMGGLIALRKSALVKPMATLIAESPYSKQSHYGADQFFLESTFYRTLLPHAQIFDRYGFYEPKHMLTEFREPIRNALFVGQVHLFRSDGTEYTEFEA